MTGLTAYLWLGAALFGLGTYGVLAKKNAIVALMCIEMMLSAANINLAAFNRFVAQSDLAGQVFALFSVSVAAAEAALGLAMIIALSRHRRTVELDEFDMLKG